MCGLGFVVELHRGAQHDVVANGLTILRRLAHRGAVGCDPLTGDGAGILLQIPDQLFRETVRFKLPVPGAYGVVMVFLARDEGRRRRQQARLEEAVRHYGQRVLGWRDVPVVEDALGPLARATAPVVRQLFVARDASTLDDASADLGDTFEAALLRIRKRAGKANSAWGDGDDFYAASASCRTVVYKGLLLPEQIDVFYKDLADPRTVSELAIVHSRFSTNTLPTWDRAHPFRRVAHNGEINTLRGNVGWMAAREGAIATNAGADSRGDLNSRVSVHVDIEDMRPIIRTSGSDSASLDNVVDFLLAGGRSLAHVMMMLVPEAWSTQADMPDDVRAFYEYHASLVEPWDGPAALLFTDGKQVGAILDRNGLRPLKYVVTAEGRVVGASELGVLDLPEASIVEKGRVQPGKMLLVDCVEHRIVSDAEIKKQVASRAPYGEWLGSNKIDLKHLPDVPQIYSLEKGERERLMRVFGYTREELRVVIGPMAERGEEPVGSMGNDAPLAVLDDRPQLLFRYFKQQFAQVTNPPIDPIREKLVMSLVSCVGGEGSLLDETPEQCRLLELPHPILTNRDLAKLKANPYGFFRTAVLSTTFDAHAPNGGGVALQAALRALCDEAERAVDRGHSVVVLSDRGVDAERAPIPSLLATAAVHHHLLRAGKRTRVGLVVESAEPREVADFALLVGYGAGAVNPYLALELAAAHGTEAPARYVAAIKKGLLKVLSKMGISTLSSYHGAQIFEAVGLGTGFVDTWFPGTESQVGGIDVDDVARETLARHAKAFAAGASANGLDDLGELEGGGQYAWRVQGPEHLWNPATVANLQKAVRLGAKDAYEAYAARINDQGEHPVTLRAMWDFAPLPGRTPLPLTEIEPAATIVRRFATGAMSFGSISKEAHETLAIAMNRIGGKSNSGEGGEDEARYDRDANGDWRRSAIKQVASARFGASAHFLVNADEIQIKIAQGAKPGEGGQLPGHKVDSVIARVRHATPGVTLISPPPHHDIYSIEDLAQLIFDLKNVNPRARVSVKLVAESGVGTVAAGVAKARADAILISGHDGGTGASPLSSIQHAGVPWEIGLAEAQQVLVANGLRARVRLQADGQMKTGRDVAIAALLGAEEFGFATAPLVASGCVMMRKCHLNTCPVGVATQDPVLRARFKGTPEHVINFFFFVAEELRTIMATLGFRTVDEMVGHVECLAVRPAPARTKRAKLDFSRVLAPPAHGRAPRSFQEPQQHALERIVDRALLAACAPSLDRGEPVTVKVALNNADRALGAMLSGEIARRFGAEGLPEETIVVRARGTAGQSFGAFAMRGLSILLEGDANDYVGKGLSGGILAVQPPAGSKFAADQSVIVGNTVLYGAIAGKAFFSGRAGERFCVRNSGAIAVVEGVGDHGCEYMTGGRVVVLGTTGRNFGAGMSGGVAFVYDEDGAFASRVNGELVALEPPSASDLEWIASVLAEHVERTGSAKAARVLDRWDSESRKLVCVIPNEYKKALATQAAVAAPESLPAPPMVVAVSGADAPPVSAVTAVIGHG